MKNKFIFVIWGNSNSGKSETIKKIFEVFSQNISKKNISCEKPNRKDITATIIIHGIKVGIEGQGDPNSRLEDSLISFVKKKCSIIICASRSRGKTVDVIEKIAEKNSFKIIWATNYLSYSNRKEQTRLNKVSAKQFFSFIESRLL